MTENVQHVSRDAASTHARLSLMADPTRLRILSLLASGEHCGCELTASLPLAPNTVSHHLRQLAASGIVHARKKPSDQRWVYYRINPEALDEIAALLHAWAAAARVAPPREPPC